MATTDAGRAFPRPPARRRSVRGILLALPVVVLAPALVLQAWVYQHDYRAKGDAETQANLEVARAAAASFEAFLNDLRREEKTVGRALVLLAPFSRQQAAWYVGEVKKLYPEVTSVSWLEPDGQVLASSDSHVTGRLWPDRSWLRAVILGQESMVTNVTRPQDAKDARFSVVHGARDASGVLRGIILAVIDPNRLNRVINIRRWRGGAVSLMDSSGWLVFRMPALSLSYQERDWSTLYDPVRRALAGKEATAITQPTFQQGLRIVAEVPVPSVGWVAGAGRSEREALAPIVAATSRSALAFLVVAVLGVVLAAVGAQAITQPVERLRASARAIGAGSLGTRVPESGPAELAELAGAFNRMADQIRDREREVAWLASFPQQNPAPVMEVEESGQVHYANPAAQRLLVGTEEQDPQHPWMTDMATVVAALRGGAPQVTRDVRIGDTWYHQMLSLASEGRVRIYGVDITERKQAEQERERLLDELRRQRGLLEAIAENSRGQLVYLDRDFNFVWVNEAYAQSCRRAKEEFMGHSHFEFYPHEENEAIFRQVRDTGRAVEYREKPFVFPDMPERGVTYWDWTLTPIKNDRGEVEGLVFSLVDMTDQVQARERIAKAERERAEMAEAVATAERARAQMAEAVSAEINHRMKNNLMSIAGILQLQASAQPPDSVAGDALRDAIARIQALSVVHEQLYQDHPGTVELQYTVRRIAEIALGAMAAGNVDLAVTGDFVPVSSKVGSAVSMVANELTTNAVKYGGPAADGKLHIEIDLRLDRDQMRLRIWNTGKPVPNDFDAANQRGMGLRLARDVVVMQLNGSFNIKSHRGGTMAEVVVDRAALGAEAS